MKKINKHIENDLDFLDKLLVERSKGRNKSFFELNGTALINEWTNYLNESLPIISFVPRSEPWKTGKSIFLNLYEKPRGEFKVLKDKIKASMREGTLDICPYCGLPRLQTIDHFLPKDQFPQFSVLPLNLVPCCFDCNVNKGDLVPEKDKFFINPFRFPDKETRYFVLKISFVNSSPIYDLHVNPSLPKGILKKVTYQTEKLHLINVIKSALNSPWNGLVRHVKRKAIEWDANDIKSHVKSLMDHFLSTHESKNAAHFLFYETIYNSPEAINILDELRKETLKL